jgi:hypothetical protein
MVAIPADAPRSQDGYYWWDGSQWQPINQTQDGTSDTDQAQADTTAAAAYPMTNDLFANMLKAAESDAQEA